MRLFSNKMFRKFYSLEPYEQRDLNNRTIFTLVPCFEATFAEMIQYEEKGGHWFRAGRLKKWLNENEININNAGININSHGFRGYELPQAKDAGIVRIMALGDSCTFGTVESMSYPRAMERKLNSNGIKAEVINAGVEKYGIRHLLKRQEYYLGFKPDIATIYTGWIGANFFGDDFAGTLDVFNNSYWLAALNSKFRKLRGVSNCEEPKKTNGKFYKKVNTNYGSTYYMDQIWLLAQGLMQNNVKVVLFTLPSWFDPLNEADADMLKFGNLPPFSGNAYIFGYRVYEYNNRLRDLSAKHEIPLIDLERYIDNTYHDKKQYFWDACHLNPEVQVEVGEFIAAELMRTGLIG
ncbi:MAG: SGNH/GDSL hydrolase family protein [Dehalococcoidia bacterium]|nr:SGNH/GDSL hydrolase family protein [Dehalococcoidia bacterium]MDD5493134.1 SGNH/GDSL hydrolase family protein [Dehalococcoidia bacterium]